MQTEPADEHRVFLSTELAGRREARYALTAVLVSAVLFFAAVPFAKTPLPQVPAFIPIYESVLVICDLITAVLLFGQFSFVRSRALFVLGSAYLFTAFITVAHGLTFPGLFSPTGLLGARSQSTGWLYMFWHAGFPLFVIAYALLKGEGRDAVAARRESGPRRVGAGIAIVASIAAVLAVVCGLTLFATAGQDFLPVILVKNRFTPAMTVTVSGIWMLSVLALVLLWRRRPRTVIDLWLAVVMCAWLFDIALAAVLNAARFDLGWYAGRIYGLLAAGFLLAVLLIENGKHYTQLVRLSAKLSAANKALEQLSMRDGLTDLANRRSFDAYLADQIAVARRHKRTLALVLCDVDAFKAYNDRYGHQAGDECLKRIAAALRSCCRRPADMAARYGGEEFALILPDTELGGALQVAEAAREAVAQLKIPHADSAAASHASISGGVAVLLRGIGATAQQLVAAADQTLYQAKHLGRNRIVSARSLAASA
jgi:diguanylate cyclase (GGDEF)-like protein